MINEIKERLINIMVDGGLCDKTNSNLSDEEFRNIFNDIDSLSLVNFVVEVENQFNIILPEEYLIPESFVSLDDFSTLISNLI